MTTERPSGGVLDTRAPHGADEVQEPAAGTTVLLTRSGLVAASTLPPGWVTAEIPAGPGALTSWGAVAGRRVVIWDCPGRGRSFAAVRELWLLAEASGACEVLLASSERLSLPDDWRPGEAVPTGGTDLADLIERHAALLARNSEGQAWRTLGHGPRGLHAFWSRSRGERLVYRADQLARLGAAIEIFPSTEYWILVSKTLAPRGGGRRHPDWIEVGAALVRESHRAGPCPEPPAPPREKFAPGRPRHLAKSWAFASEEERQALLTEIGARMDAAAPSRG